MIRRKEYLLFIASFLVSVSFSLAQSKEEDLPEKYRNWIKVVDYIITDKERDVFFKLPGERDRDLFIETFWKMRDPTPGTPENEYKEEIIKRFEYVNKFFHRGTTREGWQTDMGRIYMILGLPVSIERFEGKTGIVPCQIWTYYGDVNKGLPSHFELIFFQKAGVGEYKLYNPSSDGPLSLLENKRDLSWDDYDEIYEKIKTLAPTLASPAVSIIPGEYSPLGYTPSPRNAIILANIMESPKKDINPAYATHFMDLIGMVSTEYMTNYIESDSAVEIIPDPVTGLDFVHFVIAPKSISVDFYEPKNQYFCNYSLSVGLRQKDKVIFQYTKEMPVYFPEDSVQRIKANGLAVEDSFPVAPGQYQLVVLLQNSVGKEFSLLKTSLDLPLAREKPMLFGPYVGYRLEKFGQDNHIPFKIGEDKLVVDPKGILASSDQLTVVFNLVNLTEELHDSGKVVLIIYGLTEGNPITKMLEIPLNTEVFGRITSYKQVFPVKELTPDYYGLKLSLMDKDGQIIDQKKGNFIVSPLEGIGHPVSNARATPLSRRYVFYYVLASQYDKVGDDVEAERFYQTAFSLNPDFKDGVIDYCQFLLKTQQFDRALEISLRLQEDGQHQFEYHFLRGKAFLGKQDCRKAVDELTRANAIYNSDTGTLNALGLAFYKLGERERAAEVLRASLKLSSDQPETRKLLAEIEKKRP